jgi:hypothetical protein
MIRIFSVMSAAFWYSTIIPVLWNFRVTAQTTCTVGGILGVCIDKYQCTGIATPGYCPGATVIQCCTDPPCSVPGVGSGACRQTSACSGRAYPGYCLGPSDLQCCIQSSNPPPTPAPGEPMIEYRGVWIASGSSTFLAFPSHPPFVCSIYRSACLCPSICLSVCHSVSLSVNHSVSLSVCISSFFQINARLTLHCDVQYDWYNTIGSVQHRLAACL